MEKTLIIIPTYNEKEIISQTILSILQLFPNINILIVDNNSSDGTAEIVKNISSHNNQLHLIVNKKKSVITSAYIAGSKFALKNDYSYIMQMDTDLSHNPSYIAPFLKEIKTHNLVISYRYMTEGKTKNLRLFQKLISLSGNIYVNLILETNITKMTSGFKCFKKETLQLLNFNNIFKHGYFFQIETTYKLIKNNALIKKIPITFTDRLVGKSKMSTRILIETFFSVLRLRWQNIATP